MERRLYRNLNVDVRVCKKKFFLRFVVERRFGDNIYKIMELILSVESFDIIYRI